MIFAANVLKINQIRWFRANKFDESLTNLRSFMKVIVLGGGVIGTSTAYYLAKSGAEVTLLDRQPGPALETSFANAGQVSPGYSTPWAAPGIPLKAIKWMFQKHSPLAIRLDGSLFQLQWMARMLRNCSPERYAINKERMMRVAEYSRDCLRDLRVETGIRYEQRSDIERVSPGEFRESAGRLRVFFIDKDAPDSSTANNVFISSIERSEERV